MGVPYIGTKAPYQSSCRPVTVSLECCCWLHGGAGTEYSLLGAYGRDTFCPYQHTIAPPHTVPFPPDAVPATRPAAPPFPAAVRTTAFLYFRRNSAIVGCRFSGPRLATRLWWTTFACRIPCRCLSCWQRARSTTASTASSMIRVRYVRAKPLKNGLHPRFFFFQDILLGIGI